MSTLKVRTALQTKLAEFATAKSLPVLWENIPSNQTTSFLKADIFPSETQNPSFPAGNDLIRYRGIFRITYFSDKIGKGTKDLETIVDDLIAEFPRGLRLYKDDINVQITNTPSSSHAAYADGYVYCVINMSYLSDQYT